LLPTKALTDVVQLSAACVDRLEQLVDLLIAHFLAKICENVSELSDTDEACEVLVEDLESPAVFFRLARVAEATRSVENTTKCIEVDCAETIVSDCR
jgi:hypothetical protein